MYSFCTVIWSARVASSCTVWLARLAPVSVQRFAKACRRLCRVETRKLALLMISNEPFICSIVRAVFFRVQTSVDLRNNLKVASL